MSKYEKAKSVLLGLRLATDESWVKLCENNLEVVLSDHAWCEQKAALNAISTLTKFPMYTDLVEELTKIAIEEMEHFQMVVEKIRDRGLPARDKNAVRADLFIDMALAGSTRA